MSERYQLLHGDCLEVMKTLADSSVDAVVTDPPYGLSFMGKRWDYDVPGEDVWRECLRVLKPGGHLLAFAGTRTQHRMAVRIEDAGFEIRDMIAWVYGSGFPKSLDVSKAIDKSQGENLSRQLRFTEWMRSTGITAEQINTATGSSMASHYLTNKSQPAIATADMFDKMRPYLPEVPEEIERLVCERTGLEWTAYKNREVVGVQKNAISGWSMDGNTKFADRDITAPATDAAKQWAGWGTALKPSWECVTVARKPLIGTVAENVLKHGTGGINVDGCRVGTEDNLDGGAYSSSVDGMSQNKVYGRYCKKPGEYKQPSGRWPANLIHDGSEDVVGLAGDAARFFYTAKASKADRDEGCEGLEAKRGGSLNMRTDEHAQANGMDTGPRQNHHPTVKPTDLMRYLCRLVTPEGGIVLDPFMGSGSTGKAAMLEGFRFIGIEREAEYIEIARRRIAKVTEQGALF